MFRDTWDILDAEEHLAGTMEEEGPWMLRRFIRMIPGRHVIVLGGELVATLQQRFHWWRRVFELRLHEAPNPIEPRFAIACSLLALLADLRREGRQ